MKSKLFTLPRLIIFLLVIMVAIMCMWLGLRALLVNKIVSNIKQYQAQGYQINHGGLSITGFPFNIETNSRNVSVGAPNGQSIKLGQLDLHTSIFKPLTWSFRHQGNMRIDVRGKMGERYLFDAIPARLSADAAIGFSGQLQSANFHINTPIQFQSLVGTPLPIRSIKQLNARFNAAQTTGAVNISSQEIVLSTQVQNIILQTFGGKIEYINMESKITNWPVLQNQGTQIWQSIGGKIVSDAFNIKWGDLDVIGDFHIQFKNNLPDGTVRFQIKDAGLMLDRLMNKGIVPKNFSTQIKLLLATLKTDKNNRKELIITINNGVVKYGFFTLYKF